MKDFTLILKSAQAGDSQAAAQLLPMVYEELRRIARQKMAGEARGHTLQPTALVHEAWLRLHGAGPADWQSRGHFFSAAAEAMRRILVDHARRKRSQKRGGGVAPGELDEASLVLSAPPDELLAVHEALDRLAAHDPAAAQLVKLRYFVGLTMEEAAASLDMSKRSAESLWTYARTWLHRAIHHPR